MNRALPSVILGVLAAVACSSSTSPISNIGGHWAGLSQVDTAGSPSMIWQLGLMQTGSAITGSLLCGASSDPYSVTGQVSTQVMNDSVTLYFIGAGNDTARLTGSVRDSSVGLVASGHFEDDAVGQCLSGSGHWTARRF